MKSYIEDSYIEVIYSGFSTLRNIKSVQLLSLTLCNPMDCNTPGFPVHYQLPELTQTHIH